MLASINWEIDMDTPAILWVSVIIDLVVVFFLIALAFRVVRVLERVAESRWVRPGSDRLVTARAYAKQHENPLEEVIDLIRRGDLDGFKANGEWWIALRPQYQ